MRRVHYVKPEGRLLVNPRAIQPLPVLTGDAGRSARPSGRSRGRRRHLHRRRRARPARRAARSRRTSCSWARCRPGCRSARRLWREVIAGRVPPKTVEANMRGVRTRQAGVREGGVRTVNVQQLSVFIENKAGRVSEVSDVLGGARRQHPWLLGVRHGRLRHRPAHRRRPGEGPRGASGRGLHGQGVRSPLHRPARPSRRARRAFSRSSRMRGSTSSTSTRSSRPTWSSTLPTSTVLSSCSRTSRSSSFRRRRSRGSRAPSEVRAVGPRFEEEVRRCVDGRCGCRSPYWRQRWRQRWR